VVPRMSTPAASIVKTPLLCVALPLRVGAPTSALTHGAGSDCALTSWQAAKNAAAVRTASASWYRTFVEVPPRGGPTAKTLP